MAQHHRATYRPEGGSRVCVPRPQTQCAIWDRGFFWCGVGACECARYSAKRSLFRHPWKLLSNTHVMPQRQRLVVQASRSARDLKRSELELELHALAVEVGGHACVPPCAFWDSGDSKAVFMDSRPCTCTSFLDYVIFVAEDAGHGKAPGRSPWRHAMACSCQHRQ